MQKGEFYGTQNDRRLRPNVFDIVYSELVGKQEATTLSWLQNLVCKLFKINPRIEYYYTFNITLSGGHSLQPNDIVWDSGGRAWLLFCSEGKVVQVKSLYPILIEGNQNIYGQICLISSTFKGM